MTVMSTRGLFDSFVSKELSLDELRVRRAHLAGQFAAACEAVNETFQGTVGASDNRWRVIVGRVGLHREMVEEDIGCKL